jgi:hypothetical protein
MFSFAIVKNAEMLLEQFKVKSVDCDSDFDKTPEKSLKVFECFFSFTN